MQPTAALPAQNAGAAAEMGDDLPAVQSMDWLFKKERIYLLAQFWQQVRPDGPQLNGRKKRVRI